MLLPQCNWERRRQGWNFPLLFGAVNAFSHAVNVSCTLHSRPVNVNISTLYLVIYKWETTIINTMLDTDHVLHLDQNHCNKFNKMINAEP